MGMLPGLPARLDRSRFALLAGLAVDNYGSGLFLPLGLLYATRVVGLGVNVAGTTVALATMLGFAVPPLAGRLAQRHGPRVVVVAAQLVQGLGALAYLLSGNVFGVFAAAALIATGTQLFYCSVFVLIADVSSNEAKERPFALVAMVRTGAFGLGNLTAALALTGGGTTALRWLVAADAATFAVAAAMLALLVEPGRVTRRAGPPTGPLTALRDPTYRILILTVCLLGLSVELALAGIPVFVLDVLHGPAWLPSALLAMGTVLSSVLGVRVVDALRGRRRTRSIRAGALAYVVWGLLVMAMPLLPAEWWAPYAFVAWLPLVAGNKVIYPLAGALSEALPPRHARAGYMATYQYAFTTAQVLGPAVIATFAVAGWLPWAVAVACAVAAIGLLRWLDGAVPEDVNRPAVPGTSRPGTSRPGTSRLVTTASE